MLDYEEEARNEELSDKSNFYVAAHSMGYPLSPMGAYEGICDCEPEISTLNISVDNVQGFVNEIPQLASFYSHIEKLNIDVVGLGEQETKTIQFLLEKIDLGAQTNVAFVKTPYGKTYHIKIKGSTTSYYLSKEAKKKQECEAPSLFADF